MAKRENKEKKINPELIVRAWLDKYEEDLKSARALLESHRYSWCALACQQAIEKFLKAGYVDKHKKIPPYIHKLERLCDELKLTVPENLSRSMVDIDKHYILARYPSYKESVDIKSFEEAKSIYDQTIKIRWRIEILLLISVLGCSKFLINKLFDGIKNKIRLWHKPKMFKSTFHKERYHSQPFSFVDINVYKTFQLIKCFQKTNIKTLRYQKF